MAHPPLRETPIPLFGTAHERDADRLRDDRRLTRIRPRVYADSAAWQELAPWDRYLARVHATALALPGSVFSHESAAALLGLPVFGEPRDIHVFDPTRRQAKRYGDVLVHATESERTIVEDGPLAMLSVAETTLDLARVLPPAFALAVMDAATSDGGGFRIARRDLEALARSQEDRRGSARVDWALQRCDPRAESVAESVSRAVIAWCGFEIPELQWRFSAEGAVDRTDFFWRQRRIVGESDGYGKYSAFTAGEAVRRIIEEKTREDRLRRQVLGFVRWTWRDCIRWHPLRDRLIAAGVPRVGPQQTQMLMTLARNPRSLP